MPLGGTNILWNEAAPADTDSAGAGAAEIRSDKTSIRNAIGSEHFWLSGGGASTGYHLLGSARPFYDVQSNVSSAGTDGRILVTSDTSRFFHVGSAGTMLLGGNAVLSMGSQPTGGQRFYWATEVGDGRTDVSGNLNITIPNSGYSGLPFVLASISTTVAGPQNFSCTVNSKTATTFSVQVSDTTGNGQRAVINWFSVGTRTL